MEARGQNMLEEAAEELRGVESEKFPGAGVAGAVFEGGAALFFFEDALGREGGALDVGGQIGHGFLARTDGLRVEDPFLAPGRGEFHRCRGQEVGTGLEREAK